MRWLTLIAIVELCCACGMEPTYTTDLGLQIFIEPGAHDLGSETWDEAATLFVEEYAYVPLEDLEVHLVGPDPFRCGLGIDKVNPLAKPVTGCYLMSMMELRVRLEDTCANHTAFFHELMHHWAAYNHGNMDRGHKGDYWDRPLIRVKALDQKQCAGEVE